MEQITQIFRRIHKDVSQVPVDELLNFLVFLSVSETFYKDFDEKSVTYIDQALDLIESQYTGTETIVTPRSPKDNDKVTLSFFKQISIPIKTYNKQAIRKTSIQMKKETSDARQALFQSSSESEQSSSESDSELLNDPEIQKAIHSIL